MFYQLFKDDITYTFQTYATTPKNKVDISKDLTIWNWDCNGPVEYTDLGHGEFSIDYARRCYKALRNKGFQTFKEKYNI